MGKITQIYTCPACSGTGTRTYFNDQHQQIEESPCLACGGDGIKVTPVGLDDTLLQDMFDKIKKIKKTVDDIWEKINV